jgi:ankyrin repeat protein
LKVGDFVKYVQDQNLSTVKALVESGVDLNASDGSGMTALRYAAIYAGTDMVQYLISSGADIEAAQTYNGSTVLHLAASVGNYSNVKYLHELDIDEIDIDAENNEGETPLSLAARNRSTEVVKYLLGEGASAEVIVEGNILLVDMLLRENLEIASLLLFYGADPNVRDKVNSTTALMTAVAIGHLETVKQLLEGGADPESEDPFGGTALVTAASNDDLEMVLLLLKHRARADHSNGIPLLPRELTKDKVIKAILGRWVVIPLITELVEIYLIHYSFLSSLCAKRRLFSF